MYSRWTKVRSTTTIQDRLCELMPMLRDQLEKTIDWSERKNELDTFLMSMNWWLHTFATKIESHICQRLMWNKHSCKLTLPDDKNSICWITKFLHPTRRVYLVPCDFSWFEYLKRKSEHYTNANPVELVCMANKTLTKRFDEWKRRLHEWIDRGRENLSNKSI
jgi:hypothetical protein